MEPSNQVQTENTEPKHKELAVEGNDIGFEVNVDNKKIQNIASPFINQSKNWDNKDHFKIPEQIIKNIQDELGFLQPSKIQAASIPMIADDPFDNVIAQSKNGSGKTGAFTIGSVLRVDPADKKPQVICICHTRELSNQIAAVYEKLIKGTDITLQNMTVTGNANAQIIVSTHGKIESSLKSRKPIDLSSLKAFVIDEADIFFSDDKNFGSLKNICDNKALKDKKVQYILFSATYPAGSNNLEELVMERISQIIAKAQQIRMKVESLKLDNVSQFQYKCEKGKKLDFIKDIFECCSLTQTFIFVNSKEYASRIHERLRKQGYASYIIFSKMTPEERDQTLEKFREQKINVIITTNLLARGVNVPEVQLVINYDVPFHSDRNKQKVGDADNYLHRIGRTGRFGTKGIALSIFDREDDKKYLDQIMDHYKMQDKLGDLKDPNHLKELIKGLEDEI